METYLKTVKDEWMQLITETDPHVHQIAAELAQVHAPALIGEFYRVVLADPNVAEFLTTEQVERQLREALCRWLVDVLSCSTDQVEEQMRAQQRAADVHARDRKSGVLGKRVDLGCRCLIKIK